MKLNTGVAGKFRMVAIKPDGTQRVLADWFDNLILDIGLDQIGQRSSVVSRVYVGADNTPPTVADTAMGDVIANTGSTTTSLSGNTTSAPYYGWRRLTFRFAAGAAEGEISEVGIGWDAATNYLFSRSLVKNSEGDPITVTVLGDELLDVTYELRLYAPTADVPFVFDLAGIERSCVARASSVTDTAWQPLTQFNGVDAYSFSAHSGVIGTVAQQPSGVGYPVSTGLIAGYETGSFERNFTFTFPLDAANYAEGIKAFRLKTDYAGTFQFSVDPPIMKDANKILTINATVTWSRYSPA